MVLLSLKPTDRHVYRQHHVTGGKYLQILQVASACTDLSDLTGGKYRGLCNAPWGKVTCKPPIIGPAPQAVRKNSEVEQTHLLQLGG